MKKYIVMSIIAVVALLPFAAWADTGGSAGATLTFNSVINTSVTDNWDGLTIEQKDGDDIFESIFNLAGGTFPTVWGATNHSITVNVQALTGFAVYSSYSGASTDFTLPDVLGNENTFLYLNNTDVGDVALPWRDFTTPAAHGLSNTDALAAVTAETLVQLIDWVGDPNIGTAGEPHTYNVKWDPSQLPALSVGDEMTLEIFFIVTDTST